MILVLVFRLVNRYDLVEVLVMKFSVMSSQLFLTKPISLYLRLSWLRICAATKKCLFLAWKKISLATQPNKVKIHEYINGRKSCILSTIELSISININCKQLSSNGNQIHHHDHCSFRCNRFRWSIKRSPTILFSKATGIETIQALHHIQ